MIHSLYPYFQRPLILGHRGSPEEATENTIESLYQALMQGADGIECDVQRTKDGVPVLLHDARLERTMDRSGLVSEMMWSEVQEARSVEGYTVPSIQDLVQWVRRTDAFVNLELKARHMEADVLAALSEQLLVERVIFSSFDRGILHTLARIAPATRRYLIDEEPWRDELIEEARESGAHGLSLNCHRVTPGIVERCAKEGMPVIIWNVDDAEEIETYLRAGVKALITNVPSQAIQVRRDLEYPALSHHGSTPERTPPSPA